MFCFWTPRIFELPKANLRESNIEGDVPPDTSVPNPTCIPLLIISLIIAIPLDKNIFELGQWATPQSYSLRILFYYSVIWTQWAKIVLLWCVFYPIFLPNIPVC